LNQTIEGEPYQLLSYNPEDIATSMVLYFQLFMISAIKVVLSLSTSQNSADLDTNYLTTKDLGIAQLLRV
jgi:hypothetical protein